MTDLSTATVEQIKAELARREQVAQLPKPAPQSVVDMTQVIDMAMSWIDRLADDNPYDSDYSIYVFEAVIHAVYGPDVWEWVRTRQR